VPATQVIARHIQRKLAVKVQPVCTECHGNHRIDRAAEAP
jgi:hypothetical protein